MPLQLVFLNILLDLLLYHDLRLIFKQFINFVIYYHWNDWLIAVMISKLRVLWREVLESFIQNKSFQFFNVTP